MDSERALLHRRDAEFTEIGVFLDQEIFTPRPQRLGGESSHGAGTLVFGLSKNSGYLLLLVNHELGKHR